MNTFEAFRESRERDSIWEFIRRWRDCPFYGPYVRDQEGNEVPSVLPLDGCTVLVAAPDREVVENSIEQWTTAEGSQIVLRDKPLHAWCRDCLYNGLLLSWLGEAAILDLSLLRQMGYSAVLEGRSGRPFITECSPLQFGDDPSQNRVQQWYQADLASYPDQSSESKAEFVVYDSSEDHLSMDDHIKQRCHKTLSAGEQALYEQWRESPVDLFKYSGLDREESLIDTSCVEELLDFEPGQHEPVAPVVAPATIGRLLDLEKNIAENVLGQEADLRLEVGTSKPAETIGEKDVAAEVPCSGPDASGGARDVGGETAEKEAVSLSGVNVVFANYPQYALGSSGVLVENHALEAAALPVQPGTYPLPKGFYRTLARHLACIAYWYGVGGSKELSFTDIEVTMKGLFPQRIFNLDKTFFPDYENDNYPRYGHWRTTSGEVPLLLLGEADSCHICLFMSEVEIPADDVPATFPARHEIINQGRARFLDFLDFVAIPKSLIEYPCKWLKKSRASNEKLVRDVRRELQVIFLLRSPKGQGDFSAEVAQMAMSRIEAEYRSNDTSDANGASVAAVFIFFVFIVFGLALWFA